MDYVVDGAAYRDCIANISEGGAFIETSNALPAGSPITLCFSLFQDQQPVKVLGEVAWAGGTGVGVRFRQNQAVAQFCSQQDPAASHPHEVPDDLTPVALGAWDRRASDLPSRRAPRSSSTTLPLWAALVAVVALTGVSRYDTNARIDAVAAKVDRAAQSLSQLQSVAPAGAREAGAVTPIQKAMVQAAQTPVPAPQPSQAKVAPSAPRQAPSDAEAARQDPPSVERSASASLPATPDVTYVVQEGDNLFQIARKFEVSRTTLAQHNGLTDPNRILAGQRIRIPK